MSRKQSELLSMGIFLVALVLMAAGASVANRYFLHVPPSVAVNTHPPQSSEFYLAYFRGGVENYVIYNNIDGAANALKHADVLFLGNSRMFYAMRDQQVLSEYFSKLGLSYYVMAFAYDEGDLFPEAILKKYDLHPKWVIANADPFFGAQTSSFASKVMSEGRFDAFKFRLETNLTFQVERRLHWVIPYLGMSQWRADPYRQADWVYYRSKTDGTMRLLSYQGRIQANPLVGEIGSTWTTEQVEEARRFDEELQSRGAKLVLTHVPPSEGTAAAKFGSVLGVPVLSVDVKGLSTIDGSHLDAESARRYSTALLDQLRPLFEGRSQ